MSLEANPCAELTPPCQPALASGYHHCGDQSSGLTSADDLDTMLSSYVTKKCSKIDGKGMDFAISTHNFTKLEDEERSLRG